MAALWVQVRHHRAVQDPPVVPFLVSAAFWTCRWSAHWTSPAGTYTFVTSIHRYYESVLYHMTTNKNMVQSITHNIKDKLLMSLCIKLWAKFGARRYLWMNIYEVFTWSLQFPTIRISCRLRFIMGIFSTGGVLCPLSLHIDKENNLGTKYIIPYSKWTSRGLSKPFQMLLK